MTKEQLDMYTRIQKQALLLLDNGDLVTTPAVITQMLRLQQILSGHLKTDDGEVISFPTQRLDALLDICHESSGKIIIWSRFRYDIISITQTLKKVFGDRSTASFSGIHQRTKDKELSGSFNQKVRGLDSL